MRSLSSHALSRRDFLTTSGAVVVAFGITPFLGPGLDAAAAPPTGAPGGGTIDSWLAIAQDGSVTVFTDKVELGMGVSTAFAQIVAEELDVAVQSVSLVLGDTALTPDQGGVGGSTSISIGARPVRQAAAAVSDQLGFGGSFGGQPLDAQVGAGNFMTARCQPGRGRGEPEWLMTEFVGGDEQDLHATIPLSPVVPVGVSLSRNTARWRAPVPTCS
jgi:hypothetical protein